MSAQSDALVKKAIATLVAQAKLALVQGSTRALGTVGQNALAPLRSIENVKKGNEKRQEQMFKRLGANVQEATLNAYQDMVVSRESAASRTHYRAGAGRLAGGIMRAALAREDFYNSSAGGVELINSTALDGAARQWRRLAFGAGGRGTGSADGVTIDLPSGSGMLALNQASRPGFAMPAGIFIGEGGVVMPNAGRRGLDQFHPRGKSLVFNTQGIQGRDFLTAGLRVMGQQLPLALQTLLDDIIADWASTTGGDTTTTVEQKVQLPKV